MAGDGIITAQQAARLAGRCTLPVPMSASGLGPADVMDLVAVHPLAAAEPAFLEAYRTSLAAVMERIRPA